MRDPLESLEQSHRMANPSAEWEEQLRRRLSKGRGWNLGFTIASPLVAAALAYGFLVLCQGTPPPQGGVPREVLERQMAHIEPVEPAPNISALGRDLT